MKKQFRLKNKARFYTFIISVSVLIISIFLATSVYAYEEPSFVNVMVEKGDSLWSIADDHFSSGDIRVHIFEIKKANDMDTSEIYVGQELRIPVR